MERYVIRFVGRHKGAIGTSYRLIATVEADDREHAVLALHDRFEHVQFPQVETEEEYLERTAC